MKNLFKLLGIVALFFLAGPASTHTAKSQSLVISEIFVNPAGTDSCKEFVELVATKSINFANTPYSVIVCNNGTATVRGWKEGKGGHGIGRTRVGRHCHWHHQRQFCLQLSSIQWKLVKISNDDD